MAPKCRSITTWVYPRAEQSQATLGERSAQCPDRSGDGGDQQAGVGALSGQRRFEEPHRPGGGGEGAGGAIPQKQGSPCAKCMRWDSSRRSWAGWSTEIRITQREPRTVCKINNWCLPRFGMSLEEWRHRLDGGRYPQATSVAGDRTARGLDGNTQPSVPVMPGPAIAPAVGSLPVGKEQFTQWTTVIPNFADWDFDRATP
jgi:hypothetical protein